MTELNKTRDGTINLAEVNSKVAVEEFKKSPVLQEYLILVGLVLSTWFVKI